MGSGEYISNYVLEKNIGSGRFFVVYKAYDMVRRRPVALKLLHADLFDAPQAFHDFLNQAGQASELVHPHIAWVWESGEAGGRFYLVERFVNGLSLSDRLAQTRVLPWEQALQLTDQLAQALDFAYSKGWVHGRVSPHNILLAPDQTAILSDFGLQRALRFSQVSPILQIAHYDAPYLPPATLPDQPASPSSDGYALACTLLEMLAGQNPFAAPSLAEIEQAQLTPLNEPLFPPENAPWQISRVLQQALSPETTGRFENAGAFVAALKRAVSPGAVDPTEMARRAAQVQTWRLAEQQARQQAEESERLAALEQARREIQEQARREVEAMSVLEADEPVETAVEEPARPASRPRPVRRKPRPRFSYFLVFVAILLVALASYWLDQRLSAGNQVQPTLMVTLTVPPAPASPTSAPVSSTPLQTFTATASRTASATPPRSPTATKRPSLTPSSTSSPSPTPPPTRTRTPTRPDQPDLRP